MRMFFIIPLMSCHIILIYSEIMQALRFTIEVQFQLTSLKLHLLVESAGFTEEFTIFGKYV